MIVQFWKRDAFGIAIELFRLAPRQSSPKLTRDSTQPNLTHAVANLRIRSA